MVLQIKVTSLPECFFGWDLRAKTCFLGRAFCVWSEMLELRCSARTLCVSAASCHPGALFSTVLRDFSCVEISCILPCSSRVPHLCLWLQEQRGRAGFVSCCFEQGFGADGAVRIPSSLNDCTLTLPREADANSESSQRPATSQRVSPPALKMRCGALKEAAQPQKSNSA